MLKPDPLPFRTVEWLFARLVARYGSFFHARWEGIEPAVVKEDWRHELAGITDAQLEWGLAHLPAGTTPDAGLFRRICREMPQDNTTRLPPPSKPTGVPPQLREAIAQLTKPPPQTVDGEPMKVVIARRGLQKLENWTAPEGAPYRTDITPFQREAIARYKRIIERWENRLKTDNLAAAKAEVQARVDAKLAEEQSQEHTDA